VITVDGVTTIPATVTGFDFLTGDHGYSFSAGDLVAIWSGLTPCIFQVDAVNDGSVPGLPLGAILGMHIVNAGSGFSVNNPAYPISLSPYGGGMGNGASINVTSVADVAGVISASHASSPGSGYTPALGLSTETLTGSGYGQLVDIVSVTSLFAVTAWHFYSSNGQPTGGSGYTKAQNVPTQLVGAGAGTGLTIDINQVVTQGPTTSGAGAGNGLEQVLVNSIDLSDPLNPKFDVTRAINGTTAQAWTAGAWIYMQLYAGGFLGQNIEASATTWLVAPSPYDYRIGEKYKIEGEIVKVTNLIDAEHIEVQRAQKIDDNDPSTPYTTASPHPEFALIRSIYYLDQVPDKAISQSGTTPTRQYTDPWIAGGPQTLTCEADGVATASAALTVTP
jgi:hypothetical protein